MLHSQNLPYDESLININYNVKISDYQENVTNSEPFRRTASIAFNLYGIAKFYLFSAPYQTTLVK